MVSYNTDGWAEGLVDLLSHCNKESIGMHMTALAFVHQSVFRNKFDSARCLKELFDDVAYYNKKNIVMYIAALAFDHQSVFRNKFGSTC